MKKILFVAENLQIGGVQKALVNMLETLPAKEEISLFLFGDGPLQSEIPSQIKIMRGKRLLRLAATPFHLVIKRKNPLDIFLRCYLMIAVRMIGSERLYARLLKKYRLDEEFDAAISYFTDVPHVYFNQGTVQYVSDFVQAKEKLAWIHTDPILSDFDRDTYFYRLRNFDRIVCVSEAVREKMGQLLPEYADRLVVCYNRFNVSKIRTLANAYEVPYSKNTFNIVTVGRVDNDTKRMDGIVRLCARLKEENITGFHWYLVGEGPHLSANQALVSELSVDDAVTFCGAANNPFPYILSADLFALYSAYEGYPMVIGEAQALGIYILTTHYAAAREQILPEQGMIAETDEEFYQMLKSLILKHNETR